jgi:succinate dehydrogenase/fumarate reductase flavoprotein subunit
MNRAGQVICCNSLVNSVDGPCGVYTGQSQPELPKDAGEKTIAWLDKLRYSDGDVSTATIRNNMQRAMQNHAAVFRTAETLEEGRWNWTLHTCVLGLSYFYI